MVHGRPRLLGIKVLQVVERAKDPAWGFLKDPRTLQHSCATLRNGSISRQGSGERSGGRNRKDRAGEAGGRPGPGQALLRARAPAAWRRAGGTLLLACPPFTQTCGKAREQGALAAGLGLQSSPRVCLLTHAGGC